MVLGALRTAPGPCICQVNASLSNLALDLNMYYLCKVNNCRLKIRVIPVTYKAVLCTAAAQRF